jgi:hypothetical protein
MSKGVFHGLLCAGVLAVAGVAGNAVAFDLKPAPKTQAAQETLSLASSLNEDAPVLNMDKTQSKSYSLNLKGRWGVKVEVNQAQTRPSGWSDVDAGAFFKVTPSLRVGGTVGFGPKTTNALTPAAAQNKSQPRVRVETTFNF